jgi:hypothetical protein
MEPINGILSERIRVYLSMMMMMIIIIISAACRYPLLGNDSETNKETTLAARQQILNKQQLNYNRNGVFYAVRVEML